MNLYREIADLLDRGESGVVATLIGRHGSGPRAVGSKMVITGQGQTFGSLGGGTVEGAVIKKARQVIESGEPVLFSVEAHQEDGHVCGGKVEVFLEPLLQEPLLLVIGAGHVGQSVAAIAALAGLQVALADDRPDVEISFPVTPCRMDAVFADLIVSKASAIIICTRSHSLDFSVLEQALQTPAGFIGLLGSKRKRTAFFSQLQESGKREEDLSRITTPAGLDIGARTAQEIGVSIVAQLIAYFRGSTVDRQGSGLAPLPLSL